MKERTVTFRPVLGAVVATEALTLAAQLVVPPASFGWWPLVVITLLAAVLLLVRVHRYNAATWVAARARLHRQRRHTETIGAAVDISHDGAVYGVRTDEHEAITVIEVDGRPYVPTFLRGSTMTLTSNILPLDLITDLMDQPGGLRLGIDIVSDGYRVRAGTGYPQLYVTLLADRGAAGQRSTYLVVRLDITESLRGLIYRRSVGGAAAAATDRLVKELEQAGVRARGLNGEEHDAVVARLGLGLATAPQRPAALADSSEDDSDDIPSSGLVSAGPRHRRGPAPTRRPARPRSKAIRERPHAEVDWKTINTVTGYATSYYFSADDITTDSFNQMWSLPSDHIVHVLALRKDRTGVLTASALVRTTDPSQPDQPPTLYLNPLPGEQYRAALRAAPVNSPALQLPRRILEHPAELQIPIGPTGILIGAALRDDTTSWPKIQRDDLVMLSLTDPQRPTRIVMDTSQFYVRQLLIRAAAVGERIAIYSREPQAWYPVSQSHIAVVEPGRPAEFVPTIIVNDRAALAPSAGLSSTVITLGTAGTESTPPDLLFEQISQTHMRLTSVNRTRPFDFELIVFRQEQAHTG